MQSDLKLIQNWLSQIKTKSVGIRVSNLALAKPEFQSCLKKLRIGLAQIRIPAQTHSVLGLITTLDIKSTNIQK